MIGLTAVRERLGELFGAQFGDRLQVVPTGVIEGEANFPMLIIGQPSWEPDVTPCGDRTTLPVAVVVDDNGTSALAVQAKLEELWQEAVAGLREDLRTAGPRLGIPGVYAVIIRRAFYGPFSVQGKEYPAMVTMIDIDG